MASPAHCMSVLDRPQHATLNVTQNLQHGAILCSWEHRPTGCMKINCTSLHKKPRSINGLFLPPSINNMGIADDLDNEAEGTEAEVALLEVFSWIPIHPPVIINLTREDDDDEEDYEEEEQTSDHLEFKAKTPEDLEEERLILVICCRSGDYYRRPRAHEFHSKMEMHKAPNFFSDCQDFEDEEEDDNEYYPQNTSNKQRHRRY